MGDSETKPEAQRNSLGQLLPGAKINPNGNNGVVKGYQRYHTRLERFVEMGFAQLANYFANDEALLRQQTIMDIAAIRQAAKICVGDAGERETAIDRLEGPVSKVLIHRGDPEQPVVQTVTLNFHSPDGDEDSAPR